MKRLLTLILCFLASGVYAQNIEINKTTGEQVIDIRRADDDSGDYTLRVGGFDINLRDSRANIDAEPILVNGTAVAQQSVRRSRTQNWTDAEGNQIIVSRTTRSNPPGMCYDSMVVSPQGDTILRVHRDRPYPTTVYSMQRGNAHNRYSVQLTKPSVSVSPKRHSNSLGASFGFIGLDGKREFMELRNGRSISVGITYMHKRALDPLRTVWFGAGLRSRWDNYVFADNMTIVREGDNIYPVILDKEYKKSKLGTFSIDVPVVFDFKIARVATLSTGVYGGVMLGDHTKYKFPKHKDRGDFATNFWQAGAMVRLKFKRLPDIFANYSFVPLFKNGAGPRVQPYTIGIGL